MDLVWSYCRGGRIYVKWGTRDQTLYKADFSITEWEAAKNLLVEKVKELVDAEALRRVSDLYGGNGPKVST